jgi:hypothetical protein
MHSKAPKRASIKKAPVKQSKRTLKTKKAALKATAPPKQQQEINIVNSALSLQIQRRRFGAGPNNLKLPTQLNNEEAEKYNTMLPSSSATEQWEEQLDRVQADVDADDASLSTEVEEYIQEHGATPNFWSSPAAVQYNIFNEDPQFEVSKRLIGPPGTMAEPTMVFSPKPYRIVGCVGTLQVPHPLSWFSMEGYLKHMCPDCGQIFQLTNNPDECDFSYTDKVDKMAHFTGH